MKTLVQSLALFVSTIIAFNSLSQTTPSCGEFIHLRTIKPDTNTFEVLPLRPSRVGAVFSHLWWSGDNSFSFAPVPDHNHRDTRGNATFPFDVKMTDITTEGYGNGGPPPLNYNFDYDTQKASSEQNMILDPGVNLHVQNYRNAVEGDMLYLIVTYGNATDWWTGKITIDVGDDAVISHSTLLANPHYLSNGETWDSLTGTLEFPILKPSLEKERSVLIPVMIGESSKDELDMKVNLYMDVSSPSPISEFTIAPTVAESHDPNIMIERSDAKNQCDYRGGNIHYTVKFQNEGTGPTRYVRVECFLDDKVDLESIENIEFPEYYSSQVDSAIVGEWDNSSRAVWHIDYSKRKLIFEMHNMRLETINDPDLPYLDMARDQVEFDILVNDNYLFGPSVIAYSKIYFDDNPAIVTNIAETGCDSPVALDQGGGFQCEESPLCKYKWWIIGGIGLLLLILIILLLRKKKKRVETDPKESK